MAPLTVTVPIFGFMAGRGTATAVTVALLALLGLCAHWFGFCLNDLIDAPVDAHHPQRRHNPLVRGDIPRFPVYLFVCLLPGIAFFLYAALLRGGGAGLGLLAASMLLGAVYNLWSKRGRVPRLLAEIALAASVALLCLATAAVPDAAITAGAVSFSVALGLVRLMAGEEGDEEKEMFPDPFQPHPDLDGLDDDEWADEDDLDDEEEADPDAYDWQSEQPANTLAQDLLGNVLCFCADPEMCTPCGDGFCDSDCDVGGCDAGDCDVGGCEGADCSG